MAAADLAQLMARDVAGRARLGYHHRERRAGDDLAQSADLAARGHDCRHAAIGPCDPDARSRAWRAALEQGDQRICRAMALRGAGLASYRAYHLQHHRFTQQPEDPDLSLSAPFPISKDSYRRKAIRDLTGQTFVKQRLPLLLSLFRPAVQDQPVEHESFVSTGREKVARFLAVNALLFVLFWLCGAGIWYVGVWLVGMATWLSLVTRIRNIAEHACTSTGEDPFSHARTTLANGIERALIAPYWVNYHAEHHLFMYLPCYRLPEAHRLLVDKGLIKRMEVRPGYLDVMKLATSRA